MRSFAFLLLLLISSASVIQPALAAQRPCDPNHLERLRLDGYPGKTMQQLRSEMIMEIGYCLGIDHDPSLGDVKARHGALASVGLEILYDEIHR
jgi:hypothetical protein